MEDLMQRLELSALQDAYVATLDNDRLEDWPKLFTEEALYEIIPRENEEFGFPAPLIRCDNRRMMRDRVLSLRKANIFERPAYRHCLSGLVWRTESDGSFSAETSYVVVNTSQEGESTIYQTGLYRDRIARADEGLRFTSKRCIYDTLRVQTLLAFPV
jgi:anthranilate 1,2-dioxygenase small subunit